MKAVIYLVFALLVLVGCRTSKVERSNYKQTEEIREAESLSHTTDVQMSQNIGEALQKAINERLNVRVKQIIYDTRQPDTATGKNPVLIETRVELSKETETTKEAQTQIQTEKAEKIEVTAAKLAEGRTDTAAEHEKTRRSGNFCKLVLWVGLLLAFAGFIWYVLKKPKL